MTISKPGKWISFIILFMIVLSLSILLIKKIKSYRTEIKIMKQEIANLHLMRKIDPFIHAQKKDFQRFLIMMDIIQKRLILHMGGGLEILPIQTPGRPFWIPSKGILGSLKSI